MQQYTNYIIALLVTNVIQLCVSIVLYDSTPKLGFRILMLLWATVIMGIYQVNLQVLYIFSVMRSDLYIGSKVTVFKTIIVGYWLAVESIEIVAIILKIPRSSLLCRINIFAGISYAVIVVLYDNCQAIYLYNLVTSLKVNRGKNGMNIMKKAVVTIAICIFIDWICVVSNFYINLTTLKNRFYRTTVLLTGGSLSIHTSIMLIFFNQLLNLTFIHRKRFSSSLIQERKDSLTNLLYHNQESSILDLMGDSSSISTLVKYPKSAYNPHRASLDTIEWSAREVP
ncbi:hypothetical protein HDV06_000495 [Boothiomyces sp. JEL0866]|nr:hypothetical protein HDV06_000495 [Boothiomyces sp. JEL0866]